jgi:hypothetical protein
VFFAHNGLTADGPGYASARYEPAGPISCPRSGGSAGGRRKHRPPRSPDRLPGWLPKASDRWLTTQAATCRVRRHPDLPVLPPHKTSRTSPSSAGRRVSATGGREAAFLNPPQDRPDGDPIQASAVPAGGPAPDRPAKSAPSALPYTAPWAPGPLGPTGLAGVLRVPVSIPSILDDVPTPASAAPVNPGLLNHGTSPRGIPFMISKRSPPVEKGLNSIVGR